MQRQMRTILITVLILSGFSLMQARADEVTDWTQIMLRAITTANLTNATTAAHDAGILEAAVFDAVNGVKGHYSPVHVTPAAPKGTSARAAAVQAAYVILVKLFPAQAATFDASRTSSLNAILNVNGGRNLHDRLQASVDAGVAWGQQVADEIWIWRSTDGFSTALPPFLGGNAIGEWRPTPPGFTPGANPQLAMMNPYVLASPSQFRPAGPPSLDSPLYAKVYNETKTIGAAGSTLRTADQTLYAKFWNSSVVTYFWNSVGLKLAANDGLTLLDHARIFGALNVAMADSVIAAWDAKYHYVFWRPVTAIQNGNLDPNLATMGDSSWTPLIVTPSHPEYPSAHSTFSSAGVKVLSYFYGENTSFTVDSNFMPGVVRSFSSFSDALDEIANARIYGGIHFRTACDDGRTVGTAVGNYVLQNSFLPGHGNGSADDDED